jgi:predicted short-subunit dehydrogenase-like oxidoreductase (DUF2520 family)
MKAPRTAVVLGTGAMGSALARALAEAGIEVLATWTRSDRGPLPSLRGADLVFLAVSDDAIAPLCEQLDVTMDQLVVHLAGALDLTVLQAARRQEARVGSLHPLRAIKAGDDFRGAAAGISGDTSGTRRHLSSLARRLGMAPFEVPARSRPLYHAAAVLAAGAQVALFSEATRVFRKATRSSERRARAALLPLSRSALEKLEALPPEDAITGPAVRGDRKTIAAHRKALPRDVLPLYDELTRIAVALRKKPRR